MNVVKGLVAGRVQGVWFRKYVQQECVQIGLAGYAKNLADGRVEVLLAGTQQQVEEGKSVVKKGSPGSRVDAIDWIECHDAEPPARSFLVL